MQPRKHPVPEKLVLPTTRGRRTRRTDHPHATGDSLARAELIPGEIDLRAVRQTIPVMAPAPHSALEHLAEHQITTEQVLDNKGGDPALTATRVPRPPIRKIYGITGIRPPRVPHNGPQ